MEIKGKVHCFFEQSGTFKNEFIKLGIPAEDYDIQNNFGETNHIIDLFAEITKGYVGEPSVFDSITSDDLVFSFFPCIYFSCMSQMLISYTHRNYKNMTTRQRTDAILERSSKREKFFALAVKMFGIVKERGLRMVMENPWSEQTFLKHNFPLKPSLIDNNRTLRGDYYVKPTAYWFVGCKPTFGRTFQPKPKGKNICQIEPNRQAGLCNEERSMISPDYARNFICDFILGKPQRFTQLSIFDNKDNEIQ